MGVGGAQAELSSVNNAVDITNALLYANENVGQQECLSLQITVNERKRLFFFVLFETLI